MRIVALFAFSCSHKRCASEGPCHVIAVLIKDLPSPSAARFAHFGPVFISAFGSIDVDVHTLEHMLTQQRELAKVHGMISMLSVITIGKLTQKISDEIRQKSVEVTRAIDDVCRGSATVILGSGLGATILRVFMTGFNLIAKTKFPVKVFANVNEALLWLQERPGQSPEVKQLTAKAIHQHLGLPPSA